MFLCMYLWTERKKEKPPRLIPEALWTARDEYQVRCWQIGVTAENSAKLTVEGVLFGSTSG
jgi:hypothetical protein